MRPASQPNNNRCLPRCSRSRCSPPYWWPACPHSTNSSHTSLRCSSLIIKVQLGGRRSCCLVCCRREAAWRMTVERCLNSSNTISISSRNSRTLWCSTMNNVVNSSSMNKNDIKKKGITPNSCRETRPFRCESRNHNFKPSQNQPVCQPAVLSYFFS